MQTSPVLLNLCDQLAVATKKAPSAKSRQWADRLRAIFYRASSFHAEVLEFSNRASLPKVQTDKYKVYVSDQLEGLAENVRFLAQEVQTSFTEATGYIVHETLQNAYVALRGELLRATRTALEPQYAPQSYCVSPRNNSCLKAFPFYRTVPLPVAPVAAPKKRAAKAPALTVRELSSIRTLTERITDLELALKEVQIQLYQLQQERSSP